MSIVAHRARAKREACAYSDPSCKPWSVYFQLRKGAKKLGIQSGVEVDLRKNLMSTWIEGYLFWVYSQELEMVEQNLLIKPGKIVEFILHNKVPELVHSLVEQKAHRTQEGKLTLKAVPLICNGKVPRSRTL